MQKTTTYLLFVGEQSGKAEEAINLYTSLFTESEVKHVEYFKAGEPAGEEGTVKQAIFTLAGQEYRAMDGGAGHQFSFTPAVSIFVTCESEEEIDMLYQRLLEGGSALMPLGDYGFSRKFGWLNDRYGVSWQLNLEV
ncbi:VOC family protein [Pontibacter kalidii]|uniref:VOC family protein n=1 Tax=Pontibacter kalidii TaxID=2592049 RepID=UPI00224D441E|nr:VOC family protein [Pontibacter kalidii]